MYKTSHIKCEVTSMTPQPSEIITHKHLGHQQQQITMTMRSHTHGTRLTALNLSVMSE